MLPRGAELGPRVHERDGLLLRRVVRGFALRVSLVS